MENLITTYNNQLVTSSRQVSDSFGKRHNDVTESIRKLLVTDFSVTKMFYESEFEYRGRKFPMYYMNRDGFSLLVMGFTGKEALDWKIKYINAFNAMEKQLAEPKLAPVQPPKYISTILREVAKVKADLQKMFCLSDEKAYAKAIDLVEKTYGIPLDTIRGLPLANDREKLEIDQALAEKYYNLNNKQWQFFIFSYRTMYNDFVSQGIKPTFEQICGEILKVVRIEQQRRKKCK